jgi:hypothetical protein
MQPRDEALEHARIEGGGLQDLIERARAGG